MSKEVKRVNMNGSQDPYYRYTMPCISVKVEGTTKMIKSVLTNIEDVCRAIGRPPDYLVTYLGQELSANSKIEKDTAKAYVTGHFEERKVQELVFKFIQDTVTCANCKNPETTCNIEGKKKNMTLFLTCKGCGGRTDLDPADRFVKYMILHPPTDANYGHAKTAAGAVGSVMADLTKLDEEKKKKKKAKEDGEGGSNDSDDEDKKEKKKKKKKEKERGSGSDDEDGDKKEKKKKKKKEKERGSDDEEDGDKKEKKEKTDTKTKKTDKEEKDNDSWDDDWGEDTSEDAVNARKAALAGGKAAEDDEDKMEKMAAKMEKAKLKSASKKKDSSDDEPATPAAGGGDSDSDIDLDDI